MICIGFSDEIYFSHHTMYHVVTDLDTRPPVEIVQCVKYWFNYWWNTGWNTGLNTGWNTGWKTSWNTGWDTGWNTDGNTGWNTDWITDGNTGWNTELNTGWNTGLNTGATFMLCYNRGRGGLFSNCTQLMALEKPMPLLKSGQCKVREAFDKTGKFSMQS